MIDTNKIPVIKQKETANQVNTKEARGERVGNYTAFDNKLVHKLTEEYGEVFGRNLSRRIHDLLISGKTDMESLENLIAEELGPDATREQVQALKEQITDVVNEVANPSG